MFEISEINVIPFQIYFTNFLNQFQCLQYVYNIYKRVKTYMTYMKNPLYLDLIALKNKVSREARIGPLFTSLSHKPAVIL